MNAPFQPHHIRATAEDLAGNGGIGRYVLLPGSDGRAEAIARSFSSLRVLASPRRHNLYLGSLSDRDGGSIDVAAVATGMGCPSVDIIVHELFHLGARRFLRIGTSGSLQPQRVRAGDVVVATAAVRDEHTSRLFLPVEFPAVASLEVVSAAQRAAVRLAAEAPVHFGVIHTKDSLFAREFGAGPQGEENRRYMEILEAAGVVASEMESAHLFVLCSVLAAELAAAGSKEQVLAGTILAVIGDDRPFAPEDMARRAVDAAVDLGLETIRELAATQEYRR